MEENELYQLKSLLKDLLGWSESTCAACRVEKLNAGLTNKNYLVTRRSVRYVLRVAAGNADYLSIEREREKEIAIYTSEAGINVPLEGYLLPEGHMLTRYIDGASCSRADYNRRDIIERTALLLREVHGLSIVRGNFDPWQNILKRVEILRDGDCGALPERIEEYLRIAEVVMQKRADGPYSDKVLCHNDPFFSNFLYTENDTFLLDWEFAGSGDRFFDLVSATQVLGNSEREWFMRVYFSMETIDMNVLMRTLDQVRFVVMLWNALWAMLQSRHSQIDHDFGNMAKMIFSRIDAIYEKGDLL